MSASNFTFLRAEFPTIFRYASEAEAYAHPDPEASGNKMRNFLEELIDQMFTDAGLDRLRRNYNHSLFERINLLDDEGLLPGHAAQIVSQLRRYGNQASHGNRTTRPQAQHAVKRAFRLAKWFYETYSPSLEPIAELQFVEVPYEDPTARIAALEAEVVAARKALAETKVPVELPTDAANQVAKDHRRTRAARAASRIEWTEADTRELIDEQLRTAGWEADTEELNYQTNRTLPERGRNMAIAEWPCGRRRADYALFVGLQLYAIVEAKRYGTGVYADLTQAKNYARAVTVPPPLTQRANETATAPGQPDRPAESILLGQWQGRGASPDLAQDVAGPAGLLASLTDDPPGGYQNGYRVPFLFATNGRPYLRQLETESGIWFLDVRNHYNTSRSLTAWYSPEGLAELLERDVPTATQKLKDLEYDYLQSPTGLSLRDYQVKAIQKVENIIINEPNRRRALLAMATGTGKTRTAIGLVHRLIKTNRYRRILFLVDRRYLAEQAFGNFSDNRVENLNTFADIYGVQELTDKIPDAETRLHFATVQSLVKRLFHSYEDADILPVDTYDMIIVDEAHRGYNEDGELSDDELVYKDVQSYVSQYRRVLEYFDAFALALTATPALHTRNIFGPAIHTYSYREAVLAGWLIDHDTPVNIETRLNQEGITWEAGERPSAFDPETNDIVELEELDDELHIDVAGFNKLVITEPFNRTVAKFLVTELDPDGEEKTLIFAARQSHAELIVKLLKEEFANIGVPVNDDAIMVLTGKTDKVKQRIKEFRNELYPNIGVTVDLLTTGVDIPAICNLVFLRRVSSRILYEQMVGRATRTCDDIGKSVFRIYDAVRLYENIQDVTQMRPVVTRPDASFAELAEELPRIPTPEATRRQVQQLLAKLQRKQRTFSEDDLADFRDRSGNNSGADAGAKEVEGAMPAPGRTPQQLADDLLNASDDDLPNLIAQLSDLWQWLDRHRPARGPILVSEHEDEFRAATHSFGNGQRPEDYLQSFTEYVRNNRNKVAALNLICTAPSNLTRETLKELRLQLENLGYRTRDLNRAHEATTNQAIAADIIAHIRTACLGIQLTDHATRVRAAVDRIRAQGNWTKTQATYLDRFELQLIAEHIIQPEDLEREPFRGRGGLERIDKIFGGKVRQLLASINKDIYGSEAG